MSKIKFGTDGWRAIIDEDFTVDNVKSVAQATADYVNSVTDTEELRGKELIVGYDSRKNSELYADTVAGVIAGNGIKVLLTDRITGTPAVSFAINKRNLTGGIMITASHNPAAYNGFKYKAFYSGSAGHDIIGKIEANIGKNPVREMSLDEARKKGLLKTDNVMTDQLDFIKEYLDMDLLKKCDLKVLVDSMYGSGGRYIEDILAGTGCKVKTIHAERDTNFGGINPEPIAKNMKEVMRMTKEGKYDIALATDGDLDRLGCALPDGKFMNAQYIMSLLVWYFAQDKKLTGSVVTTVCGTGLLKNICKKYNLNLRVTPVGFKYICDYMRTEDVMIGGEEAGGIGFRNYIPERDGILSGLLLLEMMAHRKKPILDIIREMNEEFGYFYYLKTSIKVTEDIKKHLLPSLDSDPFKDILGKKIVETDKMDGIKFICEDDSWLFFRLSGTEPIFRIYAEAGTEEKAQELLELGKKIARER